MKQFMKSVLSFTLIVLLSIGTAWTLTQTADASLALKNDDVSPMYFNKRFNANIDPGKIYVLTGYIELPAASLVSFQATYTPTSSAVSFGIMTPEGEVYITPANNGKISGSVRIATGGKYCLVIMNKSNVEINAQGYCSY